MNYHSFFVAAKIYENHRFFCVAEFNGTMENRMFAAKPTPSILLKTLKNLGISLEAKLKNNPALINSEVGLPKIYNRYFTAAVKNDEREYGQEFIFLIKPKVKKEADEFSSVAFTVNGDEYVEMAASYHVPGFNNDQCLKDYVLDYVVGVM